MQKLVFEDLLEDMRINQYQPLMGLPGTPLGEVFVRYVKEQGTCNVYPICSLVYNLGKIHGKREERSRRKKACKTNERSKAITAEQYKKYIREMLEEIDDERDLSWIYAVVHRKFINSGLKNKKV